MMQIQLYQAHEDEDKAKRLEEARLSSQAIEEFKANLPTSLTCRERRWLKRFRLNHNKARQELYNAIASRPGGQEFLRVNKLEKILEII